MKAEGTVEAPTSLMCLDNFSLFFAIFLTYFDSGFFFAILGDFSPPGERVPLFGQK
jgi:hypothetical protein